jgi:hypothetical protein
MAELVDASDLKSDDFFNLKGSSPFIPKTLCLQLLECVTFNCSSLAKARSLQTWLLAFAKKI